MFLRFFKDIKRRQGTRRSWKWRWVRARYLDIYSECAVCGSTKALEVHHVVPIHVNKTLELKFSNLITLCESKKNGVNCHLFYGHLGDYRSFNKHVRADAVKWSGKLRKRPYKK